jgi:hypothetical protein
MDELRVHEILFRGEQDGPVERELKRRIISSFQPAMGIQSAFLARVSYGGSTEQKIALCLKANANDPSGTAIEIGKVFRQMFNPAESLDILFLNPTQEKEVAAVARQFFTLST